MDDPFKQQPTYHWPLLKQICNFQVQVFLSMCDLLVDTKY